MFGLCSGTNGRGWGTEKQIEKVVPGAQRYSSQQTLRCVDGSIIAKPTGNFMHAAKRARERYKIEGKAWTVPLAAVTMHETPAQKNKVENGKIKIKRRKKNESNCWLIFFYACRLFTSRWPRRTEQKPRSHRNYDSIRFCSFVLPFCRWFVERRYSYWHGDGQQRIEWNGKFIRSIAGTVLSVVVASRFVDIGYICASKRVHKYYLDFKSYGTSVYVLAICRRWETSDQHTHMLLIPFHPCRTSARLFSRQVRFNRKQNWLQLQLSIISRTHQLHRPFRRRPDPNESRMRDEIILRINPIRQIRVCPQREEGALICECECDMTVSFIACTVDLTGLQQMSVVSFEWMSPY